MIRVKIRSFGEATAKVLRFDTTTPTLGNNSNDADNESSFDSLLRRIVHKLGVVEEFDDTLHDGLQVSQIYQLRLGSNGNGNDCSGSGDSNIGSDTILEDIDDIEHGDELILMRINSNLDTDTSHPNHDGVPSNKSIATTSKATTTATATSHLTMKKPTNSPNSKPAAPSPVAVAAKAKAANKNQQVSDKDADNDKNKDKDNVRYENVWKNVDSTAARARIMAFWDSLSDVKMPKNIQEARIEEVCIVAYKNATSDEVIAVSTIGIEMYKGVQVNVAMFRCIVSEPYRRRLIATELVVRCKEVLAQWSLDHPQEELLAFGTIVESRHLRKENPMWERSGLVLVGYKPNGLQIRLAWFKHACVKN